MGAPLGNKNPSKNRPFKDAISRAIARADNGEGGKSLNAIATQILNQASNGERWAIEMLADRLDGKPAQQQILTGPDDGAIKQDVNHTVTLI